MSPEHSRPTPGNQEQRQQLARLRNREFVVERSDKSLEAGWKVEAVTEDTSGNLRVNLSDRTHGLTKSVSGERLLSWQPTPEDEVVEDTVPDSNLWEQLEAKETPTHISAEIREELGAEAIEAIGGIAPDTVPAPMESAEVSERKLPTLENAKERIARIISEGLHTSPLAKQLSTLGSIPDEIIAGLGNEEARDKVRNVLQTRLHMLLDTMPRQIREGAEKNVAHPKRFGYPDKMSSRDYTVEIALAYLDGSFETRDEELSGHGEGGIGEHRTAAQQLLESFVPEPSNEAGEKLVFHSDRLATYEREMNVRMAEVAGALDGIVMTDGNLQPDGLLHIVKEQLDSPYGDPAEAAQAAHSLRAKLEEQLDSIISELRILHDTKDRLSHEDTDDMEKIEQIQTVLQSASSGIDAARSSQIVSYVEYLMNQHDQMYLMQLQGMVRQRYVEEQVVGPLIMARQQLAQIGI